MPFSVILDNIRSAHNVGSIFRTCDAAGIEKIYLCGITAYPPNPQITKTALDAQDHVAWEHREDIITCVAELKSKGYSIVALEQCERSIPYQTFTPKAPIALIIGNEIEGVEEEVLTLCDHCINIEMIGVKNSLNAAVALGIAVYHIRHRLP